MQLYHFGESIFVGYMEGSRKADQHIWNIKRMSYMKHKQIAGQIPEANLFEAVALPKQASYKKKMACSSYLVSC